MTETQKRNSSLFPSIVVFPELQRQKISKFNKSREKKLQKILVLNDSEFQRLKNTMSPVQFKDLMNYFLKKERRIEILPENIEEERAPIPLVPRTLREKMRAKGWVAS